MTRIIHAELLRLVRRRTIVVSATAALLFAAVATFTVFSSAQESGAPSRRGGTTLAALVDHGGGTEAFAVGASFVGFFVFVTFIGLLATEFSGGTFRALLLRDPNRMRVITGKLVGILLVGAAVVAFAEACTFVMSLVVAPGEDVSTANWFSLDSVGAGLRDYATVMGGVAGWAVFGTTLAVIFRSVPIALAVGFAWAGPFENIVVDSWQAGYRFFPGQVLASLIQGGSAELGIGRAVLTAVLYTGVAAAATLALVSRRDVTA
ncbi:MAG: ABC transporter permease subunit [Acidimicrobiia bacterium]|nr:ABC transporter permease subunit [Acidimicrobiia bacterium]